jgi:hypothetical protein
MGKFFDFVVKYDPEKDTEEDLVKKIFYSIFIKRIKSKKPVVIFISGDSGEGKSYSALRMQEILLTLQEINYKENFEHINVFTPLEYPQKLDNLLFNKELKKVNILTMHEAREIVKAKNWHSFLNQAVSDVNAMSRAVKRICFIIVSQFIRDISVDIRYTLNYYVTVRRPPGQKAKLYISKMWKDDRDLEKPKLRKRRLKGYLVYPNGKYRLYTPEFIELNRPDKEICEMFNKKDFESKAHIIRNKTEKLIKDMKLETETADKKLNAMLEWYMNNPENLDIIGKRYKKGIRLKSEVKLMHDLTDMEVKRFQKMINEKMKEKNMILKEVETDD